MSQISCEPLTLEHQEQLSELWKPLCKKYDLQFSEYSFANDFMFRQKHSYCIYHSDPPFLRGEFKSGYYYIPTCSPEKWKLDTIQAEKGKPVCLFPIAESWLHEIEKYHPTFTSCRSETDYLYTSEKLQTFKGRALSSRRNLLSQLLKNHVMDSRPLSDSEKQDALTILEGWQKNSDQPIEKSDYGPCQEALKHLERLELFGRIAYADGQPVGFTIGELLTPNTALLHFSKTLHAFKGITPFLYQDFATHLPDTVHWINLEQDLGLPSLRKAKEAYHPDVMLLKWHATVGGKVEKYPLINSDC